MTNQSPVRLCYLRKTDIPMRFEGTVGEVVQFMLLRNHSHESCRGDVSIPLGSVMIVSELYGGRAYLLECRAPGRDSRRDDMILCKLWQVGVERRFYGTTNTCLTGSHRVPVGTGFQPLQESRRLRVDGEPAIWEVGGRWVAFSCAPFLGDSPGARQVR